MIRVVNVAHSYIQSALILFSCMSAGGKINLFDSVPHVFIFATPYAALPDLYYCLLSSLVLLMTAQKINILCDFIRHTMQTFCC